MAILGQSVNAKIYGGTFEVVSNTGGNHSTSDDIVDILHSRSAGAGLLDAKERFDTPTCDEGTRASVIREMKEFVQDGDAASSPALYWLHGPAGVGKSAIAQSLSLLLMSEGDHAASFFFSRTSPDRSNGNRLIVTLAYQLAVNFTELQPFMSKIVKKTPSIITATNAAQMQNLIIDPINQWQKENKGGVRRLAHKILKINKKLHPRLILVDGLDECNDTIPQQQDLILCIGQALRQLSLPFRFVIISRPRSHILTTFEHNPVFQGLGEEKIIKRDLGDDEDADEQIRKFLEKEFEEIRRTHPDRTYLPPNWPLPDQIAQLVAKSSKGFVYPATVIKYIKMPTNHPHECLAGILGLSEIRSGHKPYKQLDDLYHEIFKSVHEDNRVAVRNIFHFLVLPNNSDSLRITPRLIDRYFDYMPGHVQLVLHDLLCIVAPIQDRKARIKVLHASLPDFLLDRLRSRHLYIDIGDAYATFAASFPLVLSKSDDTRLPDFAFVKFLKYMMQARMANTLACRKLLNVDFASRYMKLSKIRLGANGFLFDKHSFKPQHVLEGTAFVAAYLLVLLKKNVEQIRIRRHITKIETYIRRNYPSAAALHAVRNEVFPAMIPLFRSWASSTIDNQHVSSILAFEVPASQRQTCEEIFELYLLMMAPFFGRTAVDEKYPHNSHPEPFSRTQLRNCPNHISHMLLDFLFRHYDWNPLLRSLMLLAAALLSVSLAHANYSTSLIAVLKLFDAGNVSAGKVGADMRSLAPSITGYLNRVCDEAPAGSQREIRKLIKSWT